MLEFPEEILKMYANTKPAYKKVYNILRATILSGQTVAMERLTEVGVAEALGISRTPVRTALVQLKNEGILDMVSKRGLGIKQLSKSDKESLMYLDEILESTAAYLAASNRSAEDLETLLEVKRNIEKLAFKVQEGDVVMKALRDLHLQFHLMIAKMSGNRFLYKEVVELRSIMRMHRNDEESSSTDYMNKIVPCHNRIVEAIASGDAEGAKMWMQVDIHMTKNIYSNSKIVL